MDQLLTGVTMRGSEQEGLHWRKSSASVTENCVEVAVSEDGVHVRDSKNPGGTVLVFTDSEGQAFLIGVARGEFG